MAIPELAREVFPRRPLKSVICQVRFNEILRIGSEEPAEFQSKVVDIFSKFTRTQTVALAFGGGQVGASPAGGAAWQFSTGDDTHVLGLSTGALSLESRAYTDFTKFTELFKIGLDALVAVYSPPMLSRLGLRYVNEVIRISSSPEARLDWNDWINRDLIPQVAREPSLRDGLVQGSGHLVTIRRPDGFVNVRYGFQQGQLADGRPAEAFTLDMDSFADAEIVPSDAISRARSFNIWLYQFFRWAVGAEMLEVMRGNRDDTNVLFGATTP